jgi:hypothetical protein
LFSKDAKCVKLVDEGGSEWNCFVQYIEHPSNHVKIGGEWQCFLRARKYTEGTYLIFGTNKPENIWELFVKEMV